MVNMPMFGITPTLAAAGVIKGPLAKATRIGGLVTNPAQAAISEPAGKMIGGAVTGDKAQFSQGAGALGTLGGLAVAGPLGSSIGGQAGQAAGSFMPDDEPPFQPGGTFTPGPFNRPRGRFG